MRSVEDAKCGRCGVWKMWSVEKMECKIFGVYKMRDVYEKCRKCGVQKMMRSVENREDLTINTEKRAQVQMLRKRIF